MEANNETIKPEYILGIDTSTSNMTIALLKNGKVVQEHDTEAVRNHSVQLLPNIQSLLKDAEIKPKDLSLLAVGQGPGSYTGVRIGVTTAKTFAWSLGVPLIGVSSLHAMARSGLRQYAEVNRCDIKAGKQARYLIPLMDARRNQVFTAVYRHGNVDGEGAGWDCLKQDGIRLMPKLLEEVAELLAGQSSQKDAMEQPLEVIFVGETELFAEQINRFEEEFGNAKFKVAIFPSSIRGAEIGYLANERWHESDAKTDDVFDFVPNYARLTEAEANLLKAKQETK
ncbi:tRNA (adenosine(37)-N6)-threonylcarbamoyltransferase complex dimerization subunit type 1 TsaB [Paenibacillus albiflavus]|nr:tRNA (adenosine(37)-N6)-threonylcarbamoyltransferase complex dimerization subunit type 1 TsaB [Paenibacillus albiflavus]